MNRDNIAKILTSSLRRIFLGDPTQAEFDEEERIAREKDEANIALTKEWNDIQARAETDYELAKRLQAQEQEELTVEEKATLREKKKIFYS
ncbi:hypothetical protein Tco_0096286 [Tanacetum coccineum]